MLRTAVQGQKQILGSHWGMFYFSDSLPRGTEQQKLNLMQGILKEKFNFVSKTSYTASND